MLDSSSYSHSEYSNQLTEEKEIIGFYSVIESHTIALIRTSKNQLSVIVDGELFPMDTHLNIKFETVEDRSILMIYHQSRLVAKISYLTPKPLETQFWSEDSEDVDFGEWLFNLASSENKREIVIENTKIIN